MVWARWVGGITAAVLLSAAPSWAQAVKDLPLPTSYVQDYAGVVDAGAKAQIEALGAEVEHEAHATIEVVTIHSLGGETIESFATELEDKWKVGPKGTDRGIIMLFAIDDHKRRIEVGYGLEGVLNDAKAGDIGRTMVPDLKAGDYGSAILVGERQIADDIAKDAGVTLTPLPGALPERQQQRSTGGGGFGIFGVLLLISVLWMIFGGGRGGRGGGGGGGGWLPWFLIGNLIGSGRRGGGGFGGGDGGGGGFGGGGGDDGGFSGGFGGGSGGGGASGDW